MSGVLIPVNRIYSQLNLFQFHIPKSAVKV